MSLITHLFQGWLVLNAIVFAWLIGRGIGYGGTSIEWSSCDCQDGCPDCIDIEREKV